MFVRIVQNLWLVKLPPKTFFPHCHALYVEDEERVLFDTSCSFEDLELLKKEKKPDCIIHTHFHIDHVLHNTEINAPVWAHPLDAPAIESKEVFMQYYGFVGSDAAMGEKLIADLGVRFREVTRHIKDLEILTFGKTKLQVIHAPGHSPGHCCFYYEPEHLLFTSDIDISNFGPWYAHAASDLDDFINSINRCIDINPRILVTSHRGVYPEADIVEKLSIFRDKIHSCADSLLISLKNKPQTIAELTNLRLYYGPDYVPGTFRDFQEKYVIINHLKRLVKHGVVRQEGEVFYLN